MAGRDNFPEEESFLPRTRGLRRKEQRVKEEGAGKVASGELMISS